MHPVLLGLWEQSMLPPTRSRSRPWERGASEIHRCYKISISRSCALSGARPGSADAANACGFRLPPAAAFLWPRPARSPDIRKLDTTRSPEKRGRAPWAVAAPRRAEGRLLLPCTPEQYAVQSVLQPTARRARIALETVRHARHRAPPRGAADPLPLVPLQCCYDPYDRQASLVHAPQPLPLHARALPSPARCAAAGSGRRKSTDASQINNGFHAVLERAQPRGAPHCSLHAGSGSSVCQSRCWRRAFPCPPQTWRQCRTPPS